MVKGMRRSALHAILLLFLCAAAIAVCSPVVLTAVGSFQNGGSAYVDFFVWKPEYLAALVRSLLIAGAASLVSMPISMMAAYVFAKMRFRGRGLLFYLYIIVMMMPFQVTLLPQYIVSKALGIYDTPLALILPGIFAPFTVFFLTQIMKAVPHDIIEAAKLETSSALVILFRIVAPSIRTGLICTWVLNFTELWNAVAEPSILLESADGYPLALLLSSVPIGSPLGYAATVIFLLLPLLLFLAFDTELMEGIGNYALKPAISVKIGRGKEHDEAKRVRAKRIVVGILLLLMTALVLVFFLFGSAIRDLLSPTVTCIRAETIIEDGTLLRRIPSSVLREDENGRFLFVVEQDDRYREIGYRAVRHYVTVVRNDGEVCDLTYGSLIDTDIIVLSSTADIADSMHVKIASSRAPNS